MTIQRRQLYNQSQFINNIINSFFYYGTNMDAMFSFLTPVHQNNRIKLAKRINFTHRRSQTQTSGLEKVSSFDHVNSDHSKQTTIPKKELKTSTFSDGLAFETNRKLGNFFLEYISRDENRKQKTKIRKMKLILNKESMEKNKENKEEKKQKGIMTKRLSIAHINKISFLKKSKSSRLEDLEVENLIYKQDELSKGKNKTIDYQLWKIQVSKICKCIEELKNYGPVDKKINKWCISYFDAKKRNLIDIFMKKIIVTRSLNNLIVYHAICQQQILWKNIVNAAVQMPEKQQYFLGIEISLYRGFLEEKISHKQKLELNQIQNKVKNNVEQPHLKEFARQLYQNSNSSTELGNFFIQLKKIEEKYGNLELISIKNRKKFQNLNQSETNIKKIVYNR